MIVFGWNGLIKDSQSPKAQIPWCTSHIREVYYYYLKSKVNNIQNINKIYFWHGVLHVISIHENDKKE